MVYLDYAATSPLAPSVMGNIDTLSAIWGNPSSIYNIGQYNAQIIENIRNDVAKEINADPSEVIFTSSGSEANALAISGFLNANEGYRLAVSAIEHVSVLAFADDIIGSVKIPVHPNGQVDIEFISTAASKDRFLFSVMMCNNEIGTYQPIRMMADEIHSHGGIIHTDAVQAFGKIPIDVKKLDVDMMSISGHKIGALRGVGVLYVKNGIKIKPLIKGTQESGLRGGTYNDLAIKSLGLALRDVNYDHEIEIRSKRDYLLDLMKQDARIALNGVLENRNASNINIRLVGCSLTGQQLVGILDHWGFMVSAGSACHSGDDAPSHVLTAIGLSPEQASHSIRITIGYETSVPELEDFYDALIDILDVYCEY